MNLYLISQTANNGYDTYDSAVVAAENEDAARLTHPSGYKFDDAWSGSSWATADKVTVALIGQALPGTPAGVICASFNAG